MTSIQPTIRAATASDADAVSTILAEAFLYSPVGDWLIPDPDTRRHVYQDYFRIHVDHTIAHGTLDLTTNKTSVNETSVNETSIDETSIDEASVDETGVDGIAAALWFPRGQRPPDPDDYDERLAAAVQAASPVVSTGAPAAANASTIAAAACSTTTTPALTPRICRHSWRPAPNVAVTCICATATSWPPTRR